MATVFPGAIDAFVNPLGGEAMNGPVLVPHRLQHANANDAIAALEAKVGINGSADHASIDYKLAQVLANVFVAGSATTSNLAEGSNLYYTAARFNSAFAAKSTSSLSEGSNLYYTDARARAALSASSPLAYNSTTGVLTLQAADATHNGYLASGDWSTFNSKVGTARQILAGTGLNGGGTLAADRTLSLNTGNANIWTGQQTFNTSPPVFGTMTAGSVLFAGTSGVVAQNNANFFWDDTLLKLQIGNSVGGGPGVQLTAGGHSFINNGFQFDGVNRLTIGSPSSNNFFATAYIISQTSGTVPTLVLRNNGGTGDLLQARSLISSTGACIDNDANLIMRNASEIELDQGAIVFHQQINILDDSGAAIFSNIDGLGGSYFVYQASQVVGTPSHIFYDQVGSGSPPTLMQFNAGDPNEDLAQFNDYNFYEVLNISQEGILTLGNLAHLSGVGGKILFAGATSGETGFTVPAAAGNYTFTLPASGGSSGQFLQTNGSGVTSWATAGTSSPLTTKGDLWGYDTGNNRISVGTDGYALTADSAASLGVSWKPVTATPAGGDTQIQYNSAGNLGASAGFTITGGSNVALGYSGGAGSLAIWSGGNHSMTQSLANGSSYNIIWPSAQGGSNTFLKNDGSGNLSWSAVTAPSSSGSSGVVQFSDGSGGFTSDANVIWDSSNKNLKVLGANSGIAAGTFYGGGYNASLGYQSNSCAGQFSHGSFDLYLATFSYTIESYGGAAKFINSTMSAYLCGSYGGDFQGGVNTTGAYSIGGTMGFTGTGAYTNFTVVGGIITSAS